MNRMNFPRRKALRREEAIERNEKWNKNTDAQKLYILEQCGHGDCKQAIRLRTT